MRRFQANLLTLFAALLAALTAHAQSLPADAGDRAPRRGEIRPDVRPPGGPQRPPRDRALEDDELGLARLPGPNPFRPLRSDFGPVSDEEARQLLEFARQQQPRLYEGLKQLQSKRPEVFKRRLEHDLAPRLRMLRRLVQTRPKAAADFMLHAENMAEIFRAMRAWSHAAGARRQVIENAVERRLTENIDIEIRLLRDRIDDLESNHDAYSTQEARRLIQPDAELPPGPPLVIRLIRAARDAGDDVAARAAAIQRLDNEIYLMLDDQIEDLKERAESLTEGKENAVEARFEKFKERAAAFPHEGQEGRKPGDPRPGDPRPGDRPDDDPRRTIRRPNRP